MPVKGFNNQFMTKKSSNSKSSRPVTTHLVNPYILILNFPKILCNPIEIKNNKK